MKKNLLIIIFLLNVTIYRNVSTSLSVVKEPDMPSFFIRHKVVSAVVGTGIFATLYLYYKTKKPNLLNCLLVDPLKALQYGYKICAEAERLENTKKAKGEQYTLIEYKEIIKKFEEKWPIFLLGECTKEGWGACLLSRTYNKEFRENFESYVSSIVIDKIKEKIEDSVHYTSFGSGGLFQDLVILTKILAQKPNANLVIHCIDGQYTPFVGVRDFIKKERQNAGNLFDYKVTMRTLAEQVKQKEKLENDIDIIINNLEINSKLTRYKLKQVENWLSETFPCATLSFHWHGRVNNYFSYLTENNLPFSDVVVAVDIEDEMSLLRSSIKNYITLCAETLKHNITSKNSWLKKDFKNLKSEICSIFLQEVEGCTKFEFKNGEEQIMLYFTEQ